MLSRFDPKIKKEFNKSDLKEIRKFCLKYACLKIKRLKESLKNKEITKEQLKTKKIIYEKAQSRLISLINSVFNQPSLTFRLEKIIEKYDIKLSEKERKSFERARNKRNDIIHGVKNIDLAKEEYNIISKIIYFVLKKALIEK